MSEGMVTCLLASCLSRNGIAHCRLGSTFLIPISKLCTLSRNLSLNYGGDGVGKRVIQT
jgi:hypothetical protein